MEYGVTVTQSTSPSWIGGHPIVTIGGSIAASLDLKSGTVIGRVTATGVYVPHAPAASDGSQNACGILLEDTVSGTTAEPTVLVVHGDVVGAGLIWAEGITEAQKASAITSLQGVGVYVK